MKVAYVRSLPCRIQNFDLNDCICRVCRYIVIQTDEEEDELKKLGFNSIEVDISDKFIEELLVEYLEFILFPLIIDQINHENKKKIDKV